MNSGIVSVLGEGAWGTAIALLLADNGYTVYLWCHHDNTAEEIRLHRTNSRYLSGYMLPATIIPTTNLQQALVHTQWIFEAIPVKYLRSVVEKARPFVNEHQTWVTLSKGIEQDTLLVPTQIIDNICTSTTRYAAVAGPNFAQEVADKKITATTIASTDAAIIQTLQQMLTNTYFKTQPSFDLIGVQYAAAYKNVIALCIGILDGAGYTDNTKAACLTYGLHEMSSLLKAVGGAQETVYGLSGVGDLILTSMGSLSRNVKVGKQIGMGNSLDTIIQQTGYTPEGVNTVVSALQVAEQLELALPLCRSVYEVMYNNKTASQMIDSIMLQRI